MDRFVTVTAPSTPSASQAPDGASTLPESEHLLYEQRGARLFERDFRKYRDTIDVVVAEAKPLLIEKPRIRVRNQERRQQRDVGFFSDASSGYEYSGQIIQAQPLTAYMMNLLGILQEEYGVAFNGLLVNRYRDGTNYVSPHGDNEKGLDKSAGVVIVSWGARRLFRLRENAPTQRPADPIVFKGVETRPYHALQMQGERFQTDLKHEIPQQKRVAGERVSITARLHLPEYEGMLAKIRARLEQQLAPQAGTKRPREEDWE